MSPAGPDLATSTAPLRATYVAFVAAGVGMATWAGRIPQLRDSLELSPSALGVVLLCVAAGSVVTLVTAGRLVDRFGTRRAVGGGGVVVGAGLALVAVGAGTGALPVAGGLLLVGLGNGVWDVAMNVHASRLERLLDRPVMSRFHAGFSVGTVAGAGLAALAVSFDVGVTPHLLLVAVVMAAVVPRAVGGFLPDLDGPTDGPTAVPTAGATGGPTAGPTAGSTEQPSGVEQPRPRSAWTEPRTLAVGLVVLAFALAEGSAGDWVGVALIDGHGTSAVTATIGYALFLAAMTLGRWFGPELLLRVSRPRALQGLTVLSIGGLLLFVLAPVVPLALAGVVLWGLGTSLGFPVGMSAAGDDPVRAAPRVSVVATIGYLAFLAGPPAIGFLGDEVTVLKALLAVAGVLALASVLTPATAGPTGAASRVSGEPGPPNP